ncbi:hypothetical protein [Phocaeicola vulgatus]|nr:hypothetical protein [Phocaeicola vulgatus]MCQ5267516.1 hypothetical protein [Phocaeicola vulgatus]MCQ5318773.1 hypothetical protein [Phocaeicola vulgatus]MCQ5330882.1 hypothetical protein [Phocaeicola vulgatus]
MDYTKVIILILWWRNFQLEYWRTFQLVSTVLGKHSEISGCVAESEIKQITTDENVIKIVEEYGLNSGYNPFEYTLCTSETEDIPDNGVDWDDCTVQEYIDFMRKGIIPQYYEKDYKEWLSSQKED